MTNDESRLVITIDEPNFFAALEAPEITFFYFIDFFILDCICGH